VLTPDAADYDREQERLPAHAKHSQILQGCKRVILPPNQLRPAIDKVVDTWVRRDQRLLQEAAQRAVSEHCGERLEQQPLRKGG
jgi:hypothetical protein